MSVASSGASAQLDEVGWWSPDDLGQRGAEPTEAVRLDERDFSWLREELLCHFLEHGVHVRSVHLGPGARVHHDVVQRYFG